MKSIIQVKNLSKKYRLGLKEKQSDTLIGHISQIIKSPFENFKQIKKLNRFKENDESIFWALSDVNFEVKEGEVLGIIGKNGAGKSTLLKILSGITDPTEGKIEIHGRVASLLEVGTGFHPELSGRENIYMNGTILGMTRKEIDSKLDEIIDFSGIEKFIDTPVKFYSSGMKVRLGFSVAAHLDPEILIIDEVLAVGDYDFQAKCLGKMEDVAGSGRTVLFVSHNLEAIKNLCNRCIVLKDGEIKFEGDVLKAIKVYLGESLENSSIAFDLNLHPDKRNIGLGLVSIKTYVDGVYGNEIGAGQELKVSFEYNVLTEHLGIPMDVGFGLFDSEGKGILAFNNSNFKQKIVLNQEKGIIDVIIPKFPIYRTENLLLTLYFGYIGKYYEVLSRVCSISCVQNDFLNSGRPLDKKLNNIYLPEIKFKINCL